MLQTIKIKNFALIENAEIPFEPGLNILSGETGAGKSIVLDAISLLLGGRANIETIRSGSDEAVVEGFFDLEHLPHVKARMKEVGLPLDGHDLLIRRTLHKNGKNRIFINGELATLNMLSQVCEDLVDLCGQHEHQSLFKSGVQLELLDRYASAQKQQVIAKEKFLLAKALKDEWENLKRKEEERVQRLEFVKFQVEELTSAKLIPGEDEQLQSEKKLLQSSEQRMSLVSQIDSSLDGDDGALSRVKVALSRCKSLLQIDPSSEGLYQALERAHAELQEASSLAHHYLGEGDASPERLMEVQERLSLITNFKRKYGSNVTEMLAHQEKLVAEMDTLLNLNDRLDSLQKEFDEAKAHAIDSAKSLFKLRKTGALSFMKLVAKELKELKMADAEIIFSLNFNSDFDSFGTDSLGTELDLLVRTNLGEEQKSIQKIVSGGELSRLMLAIRRVIADRGGIGVYLFDEIDAGLGGQTAFTVGRKLKSVAKNNQVICITHVPQVACFADHHLSISKHTSKGRTVTEVKVLPQMARREEIARMLGSEKFTPTALKNAKELIESAQS